MEKKYRPITYLIALILVISYCFWSQLMTYLTTKFGLPEIVVLVGLLLAILFLVAIAVGSYVGHPFGLFIIIGQAIDEYREYRAKHPKPKTSNKARVWFFVILGMIALAIWLTIYEANQNPQASSVLPETSPVNTPIPIEIFREIIEIDHGHLSNPMEQVLLAVKDGCQPHQYIRIWVNEIKTDYPCIPSGKG